MITVIGSLNMDLVTTTEKTPRVGETLIGKDFKSIPGGKGANQADAIAKLDGDVVMIGKVGNDEFGDRLKNSLKNDGVDVTYIKEVKDISTGIASIIVNGDGDNSIVVVPGANFKLDKTDIDKSIEALEKSDIIVSQLEVPIDTVKYSFKKAKELAKFTILNPAPANKLDDELISNIDLLTPNETELETLSGVSIKNDDDILKAAKILIDKGVKELIVTTGEKGCLYINEYKHKSYKAHKVDVKDTTAAGDSFTAALAVALSEGKNMDSAITLALKVAGLTVTKKGAQSSLPTKDDVKSFKGGK
ncbi:MAG: ribokinase [Firmicutes bacterium]|nr:ribokinase [Bacillota bacterium]